MEREGGGARVLLGSQGLSESGEREWMGFCGKAVEKKID